MVFSMYDIAEQIKRNTVSAKSLNFYLFLDFYEEEFEERSLSKSCLSGPLAQFNSEGNAAFEYKGKNYSFMRYQIKHGYLRDPEWNHDFHVCEDGNIHAVEDYGIYESIKKEAKKYYL